MEELKQKEAAYEKKITDLKKKHEEDL